jgi:DNA invertase Pin-like site-specific DNA recombinase
LISYVSALVRSTNSNMKTAIYARVSTSNSQSPEMQLAELREYAPRRGWEIFAEYVDSGISGSKESRKVVARDGVEPFCVPCYQ